MVAFGYHSPRENNCQSRHTSIIETAILRGVGGELLHSTNKTGFPTCQDTACAKIFDRLRGLGLWNYIGTPRETGIPSRAKQPFREGVDDKPF